MNRTDFLGFPVDNTTDREVIAFVAEAIDHGEKHYIMVQNANKMYLSNRNLDLAGIIQAASIILPENAINIGMFLLGKPLKERNVGGVIMMQHMLELAHHEKLSVYLWGGRQKNLELLVQKIGEKFPGIILAGFHHGYCEESEQMLVTEYIRSVSPNFLFIGMGSPKQELLIGRFFRRFNSNIVLGVGGSFNVLAGIEKPAPAWTKYGVEWLYRSIMDPRKLKRYAVVNSFYAYRFIRYLMVKK